jgi:hypothetical protein
MISSGLPTRVSLQKRNNFLCILKENNQICTSKTNCGCHIYNAVAESKEKHGVWDPMLELTISYNLTLCPLQSRLQHIYHGYSNARVDLNPMPRVYFIPSQTLDLASDDSTVRPVA